MPGRARAALDVGNPSVATNPQRLADRRAVPRDQALRDSRHPRCKGSATVHRKVSTGVPFPGDDHPRFALVAAQGGDQPGPALHLMQLHPIPDDVFGKPCRSPRMTCHPAERLGRSRTGLMMRNSFCTGRQAASHGNLVGLPIVAFVVDVDHGAHGADRKAGFLSPSGTDLPMPLQHFNCRRLTP